MPQPSSPQPIDGVVAALAMEETQALDFQLASFPESPQDIDSVEVSRRHRARNEDFTGPNFMWSASCLGKSWGWGTLAAAWIFYMSSKSP